MATERPAQHREPAPRPGTPPTGPALAHPPTQSALGDLHRRGWVAFGVTVVLCGTAALAARLGAPEDLWLWISAMGGAGVVLTVWIAGRNRRVRSVLARSPWIVRPGRYRVAGIGRYQTPILVLAAHDGDDERVCSVRAWRWELGALEPGAGSFWVAGDPRQGAVVADPGAEAVVPLKVPRWGWWRERLHRWSIPPEERKR